MAIVLIGLVDLAVKLISIVLILDALISFAPIAPWHPVRRTLDQLAEPFVRPIRNILPPVGMFDFSVMVALIVVQILGQLIIGLIRMSF